MGVMIDKPRSHRQAVSVDNPRGTAFEFSHFGNLPVFDAYVGYKRRQSGTIHNAAATH
jgi:hypothetical protein